MTESSDDIIFRVFHVSDAARKAVNDRRTTKGLTLRQFVAEALEELPAMRAALERELPNPAAKDMRPIRLPLSQRLLQSLAAASEVTGIPASRLVLSALMRASVRKRRGRKPGKAQGGAAIAD